MDKASSSNYSDCFMFIDCDLFGKRLTQIIFLHVKISSVSSWPCWIKMVFMPFFRAFKVSWSWIFYPSVCAFHYTSTIARGEQKLNTCVINNRFDMKKVKGTDRPDVCFLLKVIIHKSCCEVSLIELDTIEFVFV